MSLELIVTWPFGYIVYYINYIQAYSFILFEWSDVLVLIRRMTRHVILSFFASVVDSRGSAPAPTPTFWGFHINPHMFTVTITSFKIVSLYQFLEHKTCHNVSKWFGTLLHRIILWLDQLMVRKKHGYIKHLMSNISQIIWVLDYLMLKFIILSSWTIELDSCFYNLLWVFFLTSQIHIYREMMVWM